MTKIKIKNSTTASGVPISGSLLKGELAVNITDKLLFVGDASGNPVQITNQGGAGAGVSSLTSNPSGVYVSQSSGAVTLGLQTNVFVSGSLSASGVLDGDQSAINVYAAEGTGGYSQWMKFKDYGGYYSKIIGSDDGAMYFQNSANTWNFIPSGAAAQSVSLDTSALTGYIFNSASVVQIGNQNTTIILNSTGVIATGDLRANHFIGDLVGAVVKECKYTGTGTVRRGNPMYITGTVGSSYVIEVQTAQANDINKLAAVGVIEQPLAANATGHIILNGSLKDFDTSSFNVGDLLYVGATGWITNIRPTGATQFVQPVGRVARSHPNFGEIIVTVLSDEQQNPNTLAASGTLILGTPDIVTPLAGTGTVFNTNAIAINMGGAASQLSFGAASSTSTFKGSINATGSIFNNGPINTTGYVSAASGYRFTSSAVNTQTGTTYTLLSTDDGRVITMSNASTITVTVPTGLNVGFNTTVIQLGAGQVVFATGAGSPTLNSYGSALKITGQYGAASIISYASNSYNLAGTLST
jgi:hypothetical protein